MIDNIKENFEKMFCRINFNFTKDRMFTPIGLELSSTNVFFENENEFVLKDVTFAFYDPIDNSIHINIEHPFFTSCKNNFEKEARLVFILFHEINHKLLLHTPQRLGNKIANLWNIAADYEVHNMLYTYINVNQTNNDIENIELKEFFNEIYKMMLNSDQAHHKFTEKDQEDPANPKFFFDSNLIANIAEEIYAKIENSKEESAKSYSIQMPYDSFKPNEGDNSFDVTVDEVTYTLPNGQKVKSYNINWPENNNLPSDHQKSDEQKRIEEQRTNLNRSLMENQLSEIAKNNRGTDSAKCSQFLKKLFHIKVDWEKILRNSLHTILEKSDYFSWSQVRTSTFLLPNMSYLPDIMTDENKYGTLIIARDESGSMSEEAISKAAQIILEAKDHYKKIVVLKHDTKISEIKEFEDIDMDVLKSIKTRSSCGGTSHKDVFEYLRDYKKSHPEEDISCFIGITDLCSDIESYQDIVPNKIPMIWLAPISSQEYFKNIKGKIIPVEL